MKTINKLPEGGDHVVIDGTVHLVEWHDDTRFFLCCTWEYPDGYRARESHVTTDAAVDCIGCLVADINLGPHTVPGNA